MWLATWSFGFAPLCSRMGVTSGAREDPHVRMARLTETLGHMPSFREWLIDSGFSHATARAVGEALGGVARTQLEHMRTEEVRAALERERKRAHWAYGSGPGTLAGDEDL